MEGLPCSPCKRRKVANTLAKKFKVTEGDDDSTRKGHTKMSDETSQAITAFFCRDDISWQSTNRKDGVISRRKDGTKEYIPKRFLVLTMKECHSLFLQENPNHHVVQVLLHQTMPCLTFKGFSS